MIHAFIVTHVCRLLPRKFLICNKYQDCEQAENLNLRALVLDFRFLCLGSGMLSSTTSFLAEIKEKS